MTRAYKFKTDPMAKQLEGFNLSRDKRAFAYFMEQGTGKTKLTIDVAGRLFEQEEIDAMVVAAPSEGDVPYNWLDQIEQHLPDRINRHAAIFRTQSTAAERKAVAKLYDRGPRRLDVLTINIEAVRSGQAGYKEVVKFLRAHGLRAMVVVDESDRIKSMQAAQTKAMVRFGGWVPYRRILSGTPVTGPLDAFSQFYFLDPDILGFDNFTAFKAHFCQMLPPESGLVRHIVESKARSVDPSKRDALRRRMISIVQIPARDAMGRPVYKNTDELAKLIKPYSYRVLKTECMDLPPKVYMRRYVNLTPKQREIYERVKKEVFAEFVHDRKLHSITTDMAIKRLLRLSQVCCNHFHPDPDPERPEVVPVRIEKPRKEKGKWVFTNPRVVDVLDILKMHPEEKIIVWCRHHPHIDEVTEALRAEYGDAAVGHLHGRQSKREQNETKERFQDPKHPLRLLIGQQRSGIGIDLFEGSVAIYYSNTFSLIDRLQSEDREHRKGQKRRVMIYDIEAHETLDRRIIAALKSKKDIADLILEDNPTNWI
jgi:SNF2 family DNA or RNA helicase